MQKNRTIASLVLCINYCLSRIGIVSRIPLAAAICFLLSGVLAGCGLTVKNTSGGTDPQQTGSPRDGEFSLSVNPGSISLTSGGEAQTVQVSASSVSGVVGSVNVDLSGLPPGVTATPSTLILNPGVQQPITLAAAQNAGLGTTEANLLATSGSNTISAQVALTISAQTPGGTPYPLPPTPLEALTGCVNPNTGISNGDWGTGGAYPVYLDPQSVDLDAPAYTTNTIFWTSRETKPGQSVLMTGAFTPATKTIRVAIIPPGTVDWQAVVGSSGITVAATQQGSAEGELPPAPETTWLSFVVPAALPSGVYGFEIIDPTAAPVFGLANLPAISWAGGVPSDTGPATALQHQVHDCGAEAGEYLRIFGKNFVSSDQVVLQSSAGQTYSLTVSKADPNSIAAVIPATLPPGVYDLWVGSLPWGATSSAASQITIYAPPDYKISSVDCPLVDGGLTDDTEALQACLDRSAPAAGNLTYITLAAGTFAISGTITPHPYEVLMGASTATTNIVGTGTTSPSAWFALPQYFGMANLSFKASANPNLAAASSVWNGTPATEGHYYFSGVDFQDTGDVVNNLEQLFVLSGPDIQIYNSYFLSSNNQAFDIDLGDGGIVSGNTFILNNYTGIGIEDSQNIIFEDNTTTSQNAPVPGQGAGPGNAGAGLSISRGNSQWGPSAVSQDIYVGYNTFKNIGVTGQQVITNDGDGGSYLGPITSSTATQVTLADAPEWNWMGTTNPRAAVMAIVSGTGEGQYSFLAGWSGQTINLATPWKVLPDSTSVVTITQYELNMTFANNTITNTLGSTIVLGDALEGVIEDNTIVNSDQGILVAAQGPYGGPAGYGPVMNTDILRNNLSVGNGNLIASAGAAGAGGIGIADFPGCLLSGLMMRENTVPAIQTMFLTNGWNQLNGVLSEQNTGTWGFTFPLPGLLIQNNTAP